MKNSRHYMMGGHGLGELCGHCDYKVIISYQVKSASKAYWLTCLMYAGETTYCS